ncbi:MAG TPA: 3-oxoacyl-[acyl-carrier-protein] synthase III C-terminal domain-containing protein [Polyangiaceae bacterium]|nr:3-oxoacyl-[acyl-carrier-protein] synthase III C-terminal domain-containing protein [Polyangiaceae bacterium]
MTSPEREIVLGDFSAVQLRRPVRQEHLLSYLAWLMATARCAANAVSSAEDAAGILAELQEKVRLYGVSPAYIARRQFNAFPDNERALGVQGQSPQLPEGFEDILAQPAGPLLDRRMRQVEELGLRVFRRWYEDEQQRPPNDLIHVTCSGYVSPSPAQRLVSEKHWPTAVTHSYHMGCYGAFPAIRTAVGLLASPVLSGPEPKTRVDIIHTEYLSAHVAPLHDGPGNIIDMTLFGDGFIGYSAYPEDAFRAAGRGAPGLGVLAHHERLIPDSLDEMTWKLGPHQFDMYLSKNVPLSIRDSAKEFVASLCARAGIEFERAKGQMLFAIHPGGPKILDHTRDVLGISEEQVAHSRRVFHELGNMSSATVPHVLMDMLADSAVSAGRLILSMGFGPGLTATGFLFRKI